jgi:hypothetical protein
MSAKCHVGRVSRLFNPAQMSGQQAAAFLRDLAEMERQLSD